LLGGGVLPAQYCPCGHIGEGIYFDGVTSTLICLFLETSRMATRSALERQVSEMTKCSICLDELTDPRSLPCLHSFCLKCLQSHWMHMKPGTKVPCPLCNQEVTLPENGPRGFKINFDLKNLIETKRASDRIPCEVCSDNGQLVLATVICVDCDQKLCERCSLPHSRWKGRPHDVRALDAQTDAQSERGHTPTGNMHVFVVLNDKSNNNSDDDDLRLLELQTYRYNDNHTVNIQQAVT